MKWNLIVIIIFLITIGTSCSSKSNNWPYGMTPFFVCKKSKHNILLQSFVKVGSPLS